MFIMLKHHVWVLNLWTLRESVSVDTFWSLFLFLSIFLIGLHLFCIWIPLYWMSKFSLNLFLDLSILLRLFGDLSRAICNYLLYLSAYAAVLFFFISSFQWFMFSLSHLCVRSALCYMSPSVPLWFLWWFSLHSIQLFLSFFFGYGFRVLFPQCKSYSSLQLCSYSRVLFLLVQYCMFG